MLYAGVACCSLACNSAPPTRISPTLLSQCRDDLKLLDEECLEVAGWRLERSLPASRGNGVAYDESAARFGRDVFFDDRLANVAGVKCATCHVPTDAFQESKPVSEVITGMPGERNSPTLLNVAWNNGYFMWDGRADSLWSQPLFAFENPIEMNVSRVELARRITGNAKYATRYSELFGAPVAIEAPRFPQTGKPGDPQWDAMSEDDRMQINRIVANIGKTLEAYMRRIASGESPIDRYIDGDRSALSADAKVGVARFIRSGCTSCHFGPTLTDDRFHISAIGGGTDRGRARGVEILAMSPFNGLGPLFDRDAGPRLEVPPTPTAQEERAFRTPSLRNVARTAPYQHDGSRTLNQILMTQSIGYAPGDERFIGAFLEALNGTLPATEWTAPPTP